MQRNSQKRQAILDILRSTKEHPTAEWIYKRLKEVYPKISFATVYRNLKQLQQAGQVRSVGTVFGQERFDGFTSAHPHAVCVACGKVADLKYGDGYDEFLKTVNRDGFEAETVSLQFFGLCRECKAKKNSDNSD